jgi:hypothetical protein
MTDVILVEITIEKGLKQALTSNERIRSKNLKEIGGKTMDPTEGTN